MVYERLGAVHEETRAVLARFAKAKAERLRIDESVCVLRTLQEFGAIFLRDLGYSMRVYAELCAPHPRLGAAWAGPDQAAPLGAVPQFAASETVSV